MLTEVEHAPFERWGQEALPGPASLGRLKLTRASDPIPLHQ